MPVYIAHFKNEEANSRAHGHIYLGNMLIYISFSAKAIGKNNNFLLSLRHIHNNQSKNKCTLKTL